MKWSEYKILAEKTLSTEFHCTKKDELLLHATIGVLTEIDELLENYNNEPDPTNIFEEISDISWYLAILGREFDLEIPEKVETPLTDFELILEITKKTLKLLDFLKKKLYYNKPIQDELFIQNTKEILSLVVSFANLYHIELEKCFETNISKLKSRYGEKFSSDRAINRNLDLERTILENGQ